MTVKGDLKPSERSLQRCSYEGAPVFPNHSVQLIPHGQVAEVVASRLTPAYFTQVNDSHKPLVHHRHEQCCRSRDACTTRRPLYA